MNPRMRGVNANIKESNTGQSVLTDAQRTELERREVEDDANPDDVIPWREVRARVAARLRSLASLRIAERRQSR